VSSVRARCFTDSYSVMEVMAVTRRCIGLAVHRDFAQVAIWEGGLVRQAGQIADDPEALSLLADSLLRGTRWRSRRPGIRTRSCGCWRGVWRGWWSLTNPEKTRAIAEAKVKTDKVDAEILAQLLAADYLPRVWVADEGTQARRRQVARRAHLVRQRTRLKNQVKAILPRNLVPRGPAADLFGAMTRLAGLPGAAGRRAPGGRAVLRQLDFMPRSSR
jgi:transposase